MSVRRTAAAVLAAGLLLAGCSDDPEPIFEPTETPSPTESSPTAEPEAQSPEDFIREWLVLQRDMQNTGDVDAYLAASRGCSSCESAASIVTDYYAAGGYVRTKGRSLIALTPIDEGKTYDLKVRSAPTKYKESADAPVQGFPGGVSTYRVTLRQTDSGWILSDEVEVGS